MRKFESQAAFFQFLLVVILGHFLAKEDDPEDKDFRDWLSGPRASKAIKKACFSAWQTLRQAFSEAIFRSSEVFSVIVSLKSDPLFLREDPRVAVDERFRQLVMETRNFESTPFTLSFPFRRRVLGHKTPYLEMKGLLCKHTWSVFTESGVCELIAELIRQGLPVKQGGLSKKKANIFLLKSGVVPVFWCGKTSKWRISAWTEDSRILEVGCVVFCPEATIIPLVTTSG